MTTPSPPPCSVLRAIRYCATNIRLARLAPDALVLWRDAYLDQLRARNYGSSQLPVVGI